MRASTTIRHIRSHTGNRDLTSIDNEAADRGAGLSAQFDNHDAPSHHNTPDNPTFELTYVVYMLTPHLDSKSDPLTFTFQQDRIHGSIKDFLHDHFLSIQRREWVTKTDRGLFLSSYAKETKNYGACPAPTTFVSYSHFFLTRHLTPTTLLAREPNKYAHTAARGSP
jgi:hypothetical protein